MSTCLHLHLNCSMTHHANGPENIDYEIEIIFRFRKEEEKKIHKKSYFFLRDFHKISILGREKIMKAHEKCLIGNS